MTSETQETVLDLLPCPFCGCARIYERGFRCFECPECRAEGPTKATKAEAVAAWNTRAALSRAPEAEDPAEHTAEGCPVLLESDPPCDGCDCHKRHDPSPETGGISREWRPEVRAFADLMEEKLRDNDWKGGWKGESDLDLFERLGEESAELLSALHRHAKRLMWGDSWVMEDTVPRIGHEAADVANFAMMIADVCGALSLSKFNIDEGGK